mgnify:FL=1
MDTASLLRQVFSNSGLSYMELEKRTGIPKSVLQRYAAGETKKIPVDAVERIARALDVSPAYLLGWQESPDEQDDQTPRYESAALDAGEAAADAAIRLDADSLEILRAVRERPEMKILFSVSRDVTADDLIEAIRIVEGLKNREDPLT